jgi:hypothetical protein
MDMARLLRGSANLLMGISLAKLVAGDLETRIRRVPYGAAGTAAVLGVVAGMWIRRKSPRTIPTKL